LHFTGDGIFRGNTDEMDLLDDFVPSEEFQYRIIFHLSPTPGTHTMGSVLIKNTTPPGMMANIPFGL
jgi:hypothetical protein